jgi:hypothetical protein
MGKHLKAAAKDVLVTMSETMSPSEISEATQVPIRTVERILSDPERHRRGPLAETRGRHRSLDIHAINVAYCILNCSVFF